MQAAGKKTGKDKYYDKDPIQGIVRKIILAGVFRVTKQQKQKQQMKGERLWGLTLKVFAPKRGATVKKPWP